MPGSKGWKKQEPSVGERWVLGSRPRDSAGIAHLASVKTLDAPLADHAHQLVGQTPLLLSIEACMGRLGGKYFSRGRCYAFRPSGATKISDHYYTVWFGLPRAQKLNPATQWRPRACLGRIFFLDARRDEWLSASDLQYAWVAPPKDFVGSADLVAELRLPNAQTA